MQIGDGFIIIRRDDSSDYQLLFSPDKGEYSNSTSFITSSDYLNDLQIKIINNSADIRFIFLSTDGIERLAAIWQDEQWSPYRNFLKPLEEHLFTENDLYIAEEELTDFLGSDKINSRTDDDKTILICGRVSDINSDLDWLHDINNLSKKREDDKKKYQREKKCGSSIINGDLKKDRVEEVQEEEKPSESNLSLAENSKNSGSSRINSDLERAGIEKTQGEKYISESNLSTARNSRTQYPTQIINQVKVSKHSQQQTVKEIDKEILGSLRRFVKCIKIRQGDWTLLEVTFLEVPVSKKKNRRHYINLIGEMILNNISNIVNDQEIDKFKFTFSYGRSSYFTPEQLRNNIEYDSNLHLRKVTISILGMLILLVLTIILILLITRILRDIILILSITSVVIITLYILVRS
jgi:hypothetical protein